MKTWQKILATFGIVFVMVVFDVIRKENGIALGGLGNLICYGVFLSAIGFVWKLKPPKNTAKLENKDAVFAQKILRERKRERKRNEEQEAKAAQAQREAEMRALSDEDLEQIIQSQRIIQGDTADAQDKGPMTTNEKLGVGVVFLLLLFVFLSVYACAARTSL